MDAPRDKDRSRGRPDDEAEIIWLFDPDAAPRRPPAPNTPFEVFARLAHAAFTGGVTDVSVRGVVRRVRRRGRTCRFELIEWPPDADGPIAVVPAIAFSDVLEVIDATLAAAGCRLAHGLEATVAGRLRVDPPRAGIRLEVRTVEAHSRPGGLWGRRSNLRRDLAPDRPRWRPSHSRVRQ